MSRRGARKNAFYLIFQLEFMGFSAIEETKEIFFEVNEEISKEDRDFIISEVDGVSNNLLEIDNIIGGYAKGWTIDRMGKVDLAILRLATYEIMFSKETPISVSINEAIEFAKKFSLDESPAFINGILGSMVKANE